jgi:hypothetical protein
MQGSVGREARMRERKSTEPGAVRTWGPFTGRQLTTIICVGMVTVLFPVTAFAVSGSPVFLVDAHTRKSAAVDSAGNVQTKVNGGAPGNLSAPSQFVQSNELVLNVPATPALTPLVTPSGGKQLILTDVHLDWFGQPAPTGDPFVVLQLGDQTTCANPIVASSQIFDLPTQQGFEQVKFSPGFIVPAGKAVCTRIETTSGTAILNAFGYLVPGGTVAAPRAEPGQRRDPRVAG